MPHTGAPRIPYRPRSQAGRLNCGRYSHSRPTVSRSQRRDNLLRKPQSRQLSNSAFTIQAPPAHSIAASISGLAERRRWCFRFSTQPTGAGTPTPFSGVGPTKERAAHTTAARPRAPAGSWSVLATAWLGTRLGGTSQRAANHYLSESWPPGGRPPLLVCRILHTSRGPRILPCRGLPYWANLSQTACQSHVDAFNLGWGS